MTLGYLNQADDQQTNKMQLRSTELPFLKDDMLRATFF